MPDPASTTAKSVAAAVGMAPTVVSSLYRNRGAVLAAALRLPLEPGRAFPQLIAQGVDGLGERLVRSTLGLLDDEAVRADLAGLATTDAAMSVRDARDLLERVQRSLVDPIVALLGVPDARMRAALIAASLGGLIGARYVVRLEPLASGSADDIVVLVAPGIQRLLDPTQPIG